MRSRTISAIAASLFLALACGGGAFTAGDGSGGAGASSGGGSAGTAGQSQLGGRNQGGKGGTSSGPGPGVGGDSSDAGKSSGGKSSGSSGSSNAGTSTSSGGEGGDGSSVPECTGPSDCQPSTKCKKAFCQSGMCGEENLPNGPYSLQVAGDCKRLECDNGKEVIVSDPQDADDMNECTTDSCAAGGGAMHTARYGEVCAGGGGICSTVGKCELCSRDACAATDCSMPICAEGKCKLAPKPAGTFCNGFEDQCDGTGLCIDCVNSGGCGECCVCSPLHVCVPA
jgi:hypothetical protein